MLWEMVKSGLLKDRVWACGELRSLSVVDRDASECLICLLADPGSGDLYGVLAMET